MSEEALDVFSCNLWICKLLPFQFPFSRVVLGLEVCIFMFSGFNCCMGWGNLGWGIFRALNGKHELLKTLLWFDCLGYGWDQRFSLGVFKKKKNWFFQAFSILTMALLCSGENFVFEIAWIGLPFWWGDVIFSGNGAKLIIKDWCFFYVNLLFALPCWIVLGIIMLAFCLSSTAFLFWFYQGV